MRALKLVRAALIEERKGLMTPTDPDLDQIEIRKVKLRGKETIAVVEMMESYALYVPIS